MSAIDVVAATATIQPAAEPSTTPPLPSSLVDAAASSKGETKCEEGMSMMMAVDSSSHVEKKEPAGASNPFRDAEIKYRLKPLSTALPATAAKKKKHRTGRIRYEKTDFSEAIDFDNPSPAHLEQIIHLENKGGELPAEARIYGIKMVPGFIVIRNGLPPFQQLEWATRCLTQYSTAEHTNLTNLKVKHTNFWQHCCDTNDMKSFSAMRWSSLGYHYDWTKREYSADNKSTFPAELNKIAAEFAKAVGYQVDAEAAIVNYYPLTSSMGGHLDDAELTKLPPIVSISLGNACIFLIGGRTRDTKPAAVWLRSGDVAIMGGESRLCYHAVPRIVGDTLPDALKALAASPEAAKIPGYSSHVWEYLQSARLNINSRQVVDENNATFAPRWPPAPLHAIQLEMEKKKATSAAGASTATETTTSPPVTTTASATPVTRTDTATPTPASTTPTSVAV